MRAHGRSAPVARPAFWRAELTPGCGARPCIRAGAGLLRGVGKARMSATHPGASSRAGHGPCRSARDSYGRTAGYLIPALTSLRGNSRRSVVLPRLDVLLGEKLGLPF